MASECHKAQNASSPPDEPTMPQSERDQLSTRHSIVFNTLVAFVVIIGFSLVSMLASLYLADALEGDAEAINQAGSLRMQAYRLAFTAEHGPQALLEERIDILERTLRSASLRSALHRHGDTPLPGLHGGVLQHWQERMRPLLDAQPPRLDDYRREAPEFVSELDVFVRTLQEASEGKLGVIRALQAGTLFIIVLIAFVLIYGLHNNLATPLRSLTKMARDIGKGDFSGRVEIPGDTELSLLARTLNQMSQELAGLYAEMEQKVDDKTAALTRSNATLQLLFNSARMLYSQPDDPSLMMGSLLTKVQEVLDTGPISLCLNRSAEAGSHTAMTSSDLQPPDYCKLPQCEVCPVNQSGRLPSGEELVTFELRSGTGRSRLAARRPSRRRAAGVLADPAADDIGRSVRRFPESGAAGAETGPTGADGRTRGDRPRAARFAGPGAVRAEAATGASEAADAEGKRSGAAG